MFYLLQCGFTTEKSKTNRLFDPPDLMDINSTVQNLHVIGRHIITLCIKYFKIKRAVPRTLSIGNTNTISSCNYCRRRES